MQNEKRQCQNCKQGFTIEPEDFKFYEKIKVPPPTWCPKCRLVRRLIWRNERALYKRSCNNCKEDIISIHDSDSSFKVFCHKCWWSDQWDPMFFGLSYDFTKPFFNQFQSLFNKVPLVALVVSGNQVNSDYTNFAANARNCYLYFGGGSNEQVAYSKNISFSKDCLDIFNGSKLELCYDDIQCERSYRLFFSEKCEDCNDSMFLFDCRNCQNCFGCANLRNKNYCIWNKQYNRDEYLNKLKEFELGNFENPQKLKSQFWDFCRKVIHKYANLINAQNSSGDNLFNAKNCKNCFDIFGIDSENCKYTHWVTVGVKDSYDNYGMPKAERVYETVAIGFDSNENSDYYFDFFVRNSSRVHYSHGCISCHDVFGCIGLQNKQYCILNKQYTKEEYKKLIPKIIEHMNNQPHIDQQGRTYKYGEFFPPSFSSFCYNETIAQEYFPLTREEALKQGYRWKEKEERNYKIDIKNKDIPNNIKDVQDDIINKVIECEHQGKCNEQCTEAFKIITEELKFYRRMNLPLPHLCPNCRHYNRLKQRNPLKLWHRKCMKEGCGNEFETPYAPERPEKVYCESCYNKEVY